MICGRAGGIVTVLGLAEPTGCNVTMPWQHDGHGSACLAASGSGRPSRSRKVAS